MTRTDLLAAKRKGHSHAVTIDKGNGDIQALSTHRSYDDASRALLDSEGNTIYLIEVLLRDSTSKRSS